MYLDETILNSDVDVIYKGKEYYTGNRYGTLVELWKNNKFYKSVPMEDIIIKNPKVLLKSLDKIRGRLTNELEIVNKRINNLL